MCFLCGSLCGLLLAALCGPLCGGPLLCGPLCGSPRRLLLAAFRSAFLRHSFSVICLSFAAFAAVLSHMVHSAPPTEPDPVPTTAHQAAARRKGVRGHPPFSSHPPSLTQTRKHALLARRVFSLDASFGLLATASASALALFLGSALCCCGVSCII